MRRLSPTAIAVIFFIVIDSFVFYATYVRRIAESQPISLSAPAPAFIWKDFTGADHNSKELEGHVVVLHFWASWCPPCREEFPKLLKAAAANKDVIFLTISSDDDSLKAQHFIKMTPELSGITSPPNVLYAWDPARTLTYDEFLTSRYPESIVIDAHQRMRRKFPASVDWTSDTISAYFKELKDDK